MNLDMTVITENAIIVVPVIVAIVQAIKLTGWVKDHFAPIVSIAIGMAIGFLFDHQNPDLSSTLFSGAIYGLMASGLYSGVKVTMIARMRMKENMKSQPYKKGEGGNC